MDPYLVIGSLLGHSLYVERFEFFNDALEFVWLHDATGTCWVRCPDGRWFHPDTMTWRET